MKFTVKIAILNIAIALHSHYSVDLFMFCELFPIEGLDGWGLTEEEEKKNKGKRESLEGRRC